MRKLNKQVRLRALWDRIITGLWFVPVMMMLAALLLAAGGIALDYRFTGRPAAALPWWIYTGSTDDARDVLSALLSSMITMTSLVFSVTMVVLTLAANQFGPRLIRNFMASPQTQFVLGTYVMTILYCLVVLPTVGWRGEQGSLPFSALSIAVVLTIISVSLLVLFIHTLGRSIVSETVIDRVGRELDDVLNELDPVSPETLAHDDPESALPPDFDSRSAHFGLEAAGYVQAVEFEQLVSTAIDADAVIGFFFRAGDYVVEDGRGIAVFPPERLTPELAKRINAALTVSTDRTPVQDPDFPIRHLVEIAVRALSPGVNDPYTAVAVIHRLSASLSRLMTRALPQSVFRDKTGAVRVVCPRPDYGALIGGAFNQVRQNGADKPLIVIHLFEAISRVAQHVMLPQQVEVLRHQLTIIKDAADQHIENGSDRADVSRRFEQTQNALALAAKNMDAQSDRALYPSTT